MANTFIELNDTPSNFTGSGTKYLQVDGAEGNVIFNNIDLNDLNNVVAGSPGGGQVLQYNSAANEWRAQTYAPYSAGNGIDFGGSGYVVNAVAGIDGGLTSNSNGIYITDIANVSGTFGNATYTPQLTINSKGQITGVAEVQSTITLAESLNASYVGNVIGTSGQITVTGGTGINSNSTLNLVATGVTAGIYGNSTAIPRITVDTYGRISSVDVVDVVASGSNGNADLSTVTSLAYANIHVAGQTSLGADRKDDDLTFAGGLAIDATTDANTDTISFAINPTDAAANMLLSGFSDVDADGITNGQALIWNSSTNKFEAGNVSGGGGSNVSLTSFSVTTATPSGNGSLTYDNAGVFTFTPANTSGGGSADQTLSISGNVITISGNNDTVDLTTMLAPYSKTDTDAQDLTIAGNVISLTGQSGNVDLTSLLATGGSYSNTDVQAYLDDQNYSNVDNDAQTLSWNAGTSALSVSGGNSVDLSALEQTLSLSANILTISGSSSTVDVGKTRFYYANQSDFPNATTYHGAIAHSHADGAMYFAHGGAWVKIPTTGDITTANSNMQAYVDAEITTLIGGANVNLDSLAEVANALGNSNTELSTVAFTGTYSDLQTRPTIALSGSDLTYDGTTLDLSGVGATGPQGNVGPTGNTGATGNGITNAVVTSDELLLTYSNTSVQNLGNIRGPVGPTGADSTVAGPQGNVGVGVDTATVTGSNLIITLSNSTTIDAGNVVGPTGATGPQGNVGATGPAGADGAVDQTLSVSGNVITISGNDDTVDLTTMLAPYSKTDTDAQDLTIAGNVISLTGQSGNVDLTSLLVSGNYNDAAVDTHLNQSNPTSGYVLSWNGSDYAWVAQSGGGGAAITVQDEGGNLSTSAETINFVGAGVTATGTGATKTITIPGGSGVAVVQRFKLNYLSNGNLGSTSDETSLIDSVSIDSATGGDVTVNFDSSINYPPASIMIYGYDYTNNKYLVVPLETSMGLRELAGGGSSGSPTLFNGSSNIALKLRLREAETGASRSFGTVTHAWIEFVVYD